MITVMPCRFRCGDATTENKIHGESRTHPNIFFDKKRSSKHMEYKKRRIVPSDGHTQFSPWVEEGKK